VANDLFCGERFCCCCCSISAFIIRVVYVSMVLLQLIYIRWNPSRPLTFCFNVCTTTPILLCTVPPLPYTRNVIRQILDRSGYARRSTPTINQWNATDHRESSRVNRAGLRSWWRRTVERPRVQTTISFFFDMLSSHKSSFDFFCKKNRTRKHNPPLTLPYISLTSLSGIKAKQHES
jgi:hypothetical protein